MQSRAATSQAEKKQRQLEKLLEDSDGKINDLMNELRESGDASRGLSNEITKFKLQLDDANSGIEMAKKESKKLAG